LPLFAGVGEDRPRDDARLRIDAVRNFVSPGDAGRRGDLESRSRREFSLMPGVSILVGIFWSFHFQRARPIERNIRGKKR
jgi:hypothetical protein